MNKYRNAIFTALVIFFLLGPTIVLAMQAVNAPIPSWVGDDQSRLMLEGRKTREVPELDFDSINSGKFQQDVEYAISDFAPMRNDALLATGELQRLSISQMASLAGYSVYPSYFGSKYLYEPEEGAVWHEPIKADPEMAYEPRMRAFGEGVAEVAERHPDIRFCIIVPAGGAMPAINPAYSLVTNPQHPEPLLEALKEGLGDHPNVTLVSNIGYYENKEEYFDDYLRTDHHWNAHGCIGLYNEAAEEMGFDTIQTEPETDICQSMGSYARNGRVVITEINRDIPQKFPEVYAVGPLDSESDPQAYPFDDHVWFNPNPGDIYFDFYGNYYRQVETYLGPGTGETILICDSFAAPMIAPLANNYETVHWVDDLFQRQGGTSIEAYIDETHPKDVWIVGIPADFMALVRREPGYFEAE